MNLEFQVKLWDAINAYREANGVSVQRQLAVVEVNRLLAAHARSEVARALQAACEKICYRCEFTSPAVEKHAQKIPFLADGYYWHGRTRNGNPSLVCSANSVRALLQEPEETT